MKCYDLIGVGLGPFNLSLAALLDGVANVDSVFLESKPEVSWHPAMMLPGAELQTSFIKDLVSLIDPTNPWSFLAYMADRKRLLEFINADFSAVPRREFAAYFEWVGTKLANTRFNATVREIHFEDDAFVVAGPKGIHRARNLVLGIGLSPRIPEWASGFMGDTCLHSGQTLDLLGHTPARRIAVIGGGQSGAEIMLHLLNGSIPTVREVTWISRRDNFEPLDDSPFVNEYFTPRYADVFGSLPSEQKQAVASRQKLTSDGASLSTLRAIYQALYRQRHLGEGQVTATLAPARDVFQLTYSEQGYLITARNGLTRETDFFQADTIVLATGYENRMPDFLMPLQSRLSRNGPGIFDLDSDFRAAWDGPENRSIFVQNAGRVSHGIYEPQLSLMAWRSARIINALTGRPVFDLDLTIPFINWAEQARASDMPLMAYG